MSARCRIVCRISAVLLFCCFGGAAAEPTDSPEENYGSQGKSNPEMSVAVEVRFAEVSEEMFHRLGLGGEQEESHTGEKLGALKGITSRLQYPGVAFLSDIQLFLLMEAIQGDIHTNVMQAPKVTMFDGQTAKVNCIDPQTFVTGLEIVQRDHGIEFHPKTEVIPLGVQMSMRPIVSADRRFVQLHLDAKLSDLVSPEVPRVPITMPIQRCEEGRPVGEPQMFTQFIQKPQVNRLSVDRTLVIPDGGTAMLTGLTKRCEEISCGSAPPVLSKLPYVSRLFRSIGIETHHVLVLVTPRILITAEEEEKRPAPPPCPKSKDCPKTTPKRVTTAAAPYQVRGGAEESCVPEGSRTPIHPPIHKGETPRCEATPDDALILRALPRLTHGPTCEEFRSDIHIVKERLVDQIDPPRFYPLIGPAQLHRTHWKCTVYYTETTESESPTRSHRTRPRVQVVYLDLDHLHLCGPHEETKPTEKKGEQVKRTCAEEHCAEPVSALSVERAERVAQLLKRYEAACDRGRLAEAKKLAEEALALNPACFVGPDGRHGPNRK